MRYGGCRPIVSPIPQEHSWEDLAADFGSKSGFHCQVPHQTARTLSWVDGRSGCRCVDGHGCTNAGRIAASMLRRDAVSWTRSDTCASVRPAGRCCSAVPPALQALMHTITGALDQTIVLIDWRSEQRALGHRLRFRCQYADLNAAQISFASIASDIDQPTNS